MAQLQSTSITGTLSATGIFTTVSSGTAINFSGQSDSFGYNNSSGLGTYIKGTGSTYIYGGGVFFDGSAQRTILHSGNFGSFALPLSGGTMTGALTISTTEDGKLVLRAPAGDTSQWNYINFVGTDGVRDAYFGTDGGGNPQWWRDDNSLRITLGSVATINDVQIVTNSGTWGINVTGNAGTASRVVSGTSTLAGVTFANTMLATQTAGRVTNFDGNGSSPSVWWTNGSTAIGAIDAIGGGGLSFWSNNGSSWQQQVSMTHGTFNVLTTLQQGGTQVVTNNGGTWSINVTGTAGSETLATVTSRGASTSTALTLSGNVTVGGQLTRSQIGFENQNGFHRIALWDLRFWDWDIGADIFSIGQGDGNVRVTNSLFITSNTASGRGNLSFSTSSSVIGNIHIQNGAGPGDSNSNQAAITFQGGNSSQAQAGIYVLNNNSYGTSMGFAVTESYATGPQLFMTASNTGVVNFPRATPLVFGNGIWHAGNFNPGSYLPLSGGTISGNLTINGVWQTNISTSGGWSRLSFTASNAWGDGVTYGVLGAGGGSEPGVMIYNPHIVWASEGQGAGLRLGRSGGVSSGAWYQVATMASNEFMIAMNGSWANHGGLKITSDGVLRYGNTGFRYVWESGTWGINITGSSQSLNFGGGSVMNNSAWAGTGGYHGYTYSGGNFRFGFSSTSGVVDVYADGNFYATDSGHLVLHTGNYSSYALPLSGGTMSGTLTVGGGISINTANGANIFGMRSESGKYLSHNAFGQDGGYSWPSLTYNTSYSNSAVGNTTFRGNGAFQGHIQNGYVPIDATKTYKVSVWIRTVSGSPLCYFSHRQYFWDYSPGNPSNGGWGNPYWWVGVPSTSWTEYSMTIGPAGSGADHTHMSGVKFIRHGFLHNYTSDGGAVAEVQGWRIEELDNTLANGTNVLGSSFTVGGVAVVTNNGGTWSINITGNAGSVNGRTVGTSTNNIPFLDGSRNLVINNPESYSGEVRLGAAWNRGGIYTSNTLSLSTGSPNIDFIHSNSISARFIANTGDYGPTFMVGTTDPTYTLIDANRRPVVYLHGQYPVVTLNHTVTSNGSHGPTIQFTHNELNRQWVIGSNGTGTRLDFGYSTFTANRNPHNGIDNLNGPTILRISNDNFVTALNLTVSGTTNLNGPVNAFAGIVTVNRLNFRTTSGSASSDPYCLRFVETTLNDCWLELQLNDDSNEEFRIYGNSCAGFGCGEISGNLYHRFRANGYAWHAGNLEVAGSITAGGDICAFSDARVKENIVTVENALDKVTKMRGVFYNRTDSDDKSRKVGVIAQEMLEVLPEVVNEDNAGMYNVSYGNIAGVLIEAIKEQQAIIEDLKKQIEYLVENK